jgi:triacylglycerol lipase
MAVPVLLVHGIWNSSSQMSLLRASLVQGGIERVHSMDLVPNDGQASIAELGMQVSREAEALAVRFGVERIDIVGFSMGALVSRWFLQRAGGTQRVRRFVSISGPHHGTVTAYALDSIGVRDMRPRSALLRDLASDADPFASVEVHCVYTPLDLMIVPATSSILAGARTVRAFAVPVHRWMVHRPAVIAHVRSLL